MKRFCLVGLVLVLMIGICSCNPTPDSDPSSDSRSSSDASEVEYMTTPCSKEGVAAFCDILGELQGNGLFAGYVLSEENCFNVTPQKVREETDCKIFKFSDSCASFVMIDNEVYTLCEWFGGYGFVNAVPCDFDNDGNKDLLVASSWGSGLHRSIISIFNSVTKESTVIYDTSTTNDPQTDLIVRISSPSFAPDASFDPPVYYEVCSVRIEPGDNSASLSYLLTGIAGSVSVRDGVIAFTPFASEENL